MPTLRKTNSKFLFHKSILNYKYMKNPAMPIASMLCITGVILFVVGFTLKKETDPKTGEEKRTSLSLGLLVLSTIMSVIGIIMIIQIQKDGPPHV